MTIRWIGTVSMGIAALFAALFVATVGAASQVHAQVRVQDGKVPTDSRVANPSQKQKVVTLVLRDSTLGFVVEEIARRAGVRVVWNQSLPALQRRVVVDIPGMPVAKAFAVALKGSGLVATTAADGRTVLIGPRRGDTADTSAQVTGTATGVIVDSSTGSPIRGVTVTVVGTGVSTVSREDGRFSLKSDEGEQVLRFQLMGYKSTTRNVVFANARPIALRIPLVSAPTSLSGVVTTATGTRDRRAVGNDITVINVDSVMRTAPVTSVTDILATRVPGLTVQRTSGVPGAPSRIRLRGIGGGLIAGATNTSNDPILIVDGIRRYSSQSTTRDQNLAPSKGGSAESATRFQAASAIDQIDPNSIETIEVFKGPSATSQWGADAGNGVIVITTKRGRAGVTSVMSAFTASMEQMPGQYASPGFYRFAHGGEMTTSRACPALNFSIQCSETDSIVRFQALNIARLSPFGTGSGQTGSATVSGGSEIVTYSLTGSAGRRTGYLQMPVFFEDLFRQQYGVSAPSWMRTPTGYQDWSINSSVTAKPRDTWRLTIMTSLTSSDASRASGQAELTALSSRYLDTVAMKESPVIDGRLNRFSERSRLHTTTSAISAVADWSGVAWLPVQMTGGISTISREDRLTVPYGYAHVNTSDTLGSFGLGRGEAMLRTGKVSGTIFPYRLVSTSIGMEVAQSSNHDFTGLADTLQPGVSEPTAFRTAGQSSFSSTTAGWYLEPTLNLKSRFFVVPGFRFDGGSASQPKVRGGGGVLAFFPKLNFSWIAIERDGQNPLGGFLTMLRPRLAFGVAGVQPDPTMSLRLMTGNSSDLNLANAIEGVLLKSIGNSTLHPERSREIEAGFEADLWGGRMNIVFSTYSKLRIDALQKINLAPSVSTKSEDYYANIGRIRNTGTEISLNARVLESPWLALGVRGSLTTHRNEVLTLSEDRPYLDYNDGTRFQVGYPISGRWARPIIGYRTDVSSGRLSLNDIAIADSAVYLGSGFPRLEIPFGTDLSLWGGLASLNLNFEYKNGLTQFNAGSAALLTTLYADPNASLGQQAVALAASGCSINAAGIGSNFCTTGTVYGLVQTVNTLRFNSISLNYNVPRSVSARFGLPRMSIALQGSNLALWTNYRGKDPDVNSQTIGENVSDTGQAPQPRAWTLRMTFNN